MSNDKHGVIIVSGGMDSVTAAHLLRPTVDTMTILSVDYGQRHRRELVFAERAAYTLNARWHLVDLTSITSIIGSSSLTNPDIEVPDGHYAEETMKATVVPNRNAMMLDIATAVAVANKAEWVATAVHSGDHAIYPDCRPEFIEAFEAMVLVANEGFISPQFKVLTPFLYQSKADIARTGSHLGVDWLDTWSCYKGGEIHCGSCSTCFERREAMTLAGVEDPTPYLATPQYSAPEQMLVVVACGKRKRSGTYPARDLYTGPYFKECMTWARSMGEGGWVICSAKYGLLRPDTPIEDYNLKMGQPGSVTADTLVEQAKALGIDGETEVYLAGGKLYAKPLSAVWPGITIPFYGFGKFGYQMSAMMANRGKVPDVCNHQGV